MKRRERDLRRLIEPYGWRVVGLNGAGHYRLAGPGGAACSVAGSPGDRRSDANMLAWLRKLAKRAAGKGAT